MFRRRLLLVVTVAFYLTTFAVVAYPWAKSAYGVIPWVGTYSWGALAPLERPGVRDAFNGNPKTAPDVDVAWMRQGLFRSLRENNMPLVAEHLVVENDGTIEILSARTGRVAGTIKTKDLGVGVFTFISRNGEGFIFPDLVDGRRVLRRFHFDSNHRSFVEQDVLPTGIETWGNILVLGDGLIMSSRKGGPMLPRHVYFKNTGNNKWVKQWSSDYLTWTEPAFASGVAYGSDFGYGGIVATDVSTGKVLWRLRDANTVFAAPTIAGNSLVFGNISGVLRRVSKSDGKILWTANLGPNLSTRPLVHMGTVYVASYFGNVSAVSMQTGEVIWRQKLPTAILSSPTIHNGRLLIGAGNNLFALNAKDGKIAWRFFIPGVLRDVPIISNDMILLRTMNYLFGLRLKGDQKPSIPKAL